MQDTIGRRIHVIGNSCAGKSTYAIRLSEITGAPVVELDALNWLPNWVGLNATDPDRFDRRIQEATQGDAWILAGSYANFSKRNAWDRVQTVVWLDLPLGLLVRRVIARSWRRWRTRERLWGTNYENFWGLFALWRGDDSLLYWIVTQYKRKQRDMVENMANPQWRHIRFIRLRSPDEAAQFLSLLRDQP